MDKVILINEDGVTDVTERWNEMVVLSPRSLPKATPLGPYVKPVVLPFKDCMWDSIPVESQGKPMGLSCNCPKCVTTC